MRHRKALKLNQNDDGSEVFKFFSNEYLGADQNRKIKCNMRNRNMRNDVSLIYIKSSGIGGKRCKLKISIQSIILLFEIWPSKYMEQR